MNYLILEPDQSIYVPADGIHAWLKGDIIECMARSDNMLATGFYPRSERDDLELFTQALTFSPRSPDEAILPASKPFQGSKMRKTKIYGPPISEFNILCTEIAAPPTSTTSSTGQQPPNEGQMKGREVEEEREGEEVHERIQGPSILLVTRGEGTMLTGRGLWHLKEGFVYFIGSGHKIRFKADQGHTLVFYRAYCEV